MPHPMKDQILFKYCNSSLHKVLSFVIYGNKTAESNQFLIHRARFNKG